MNKTKLDADLLTPKQVAEILGKAEGTVVKWCAAGTIEAQKVFGKWMISPGAVEKKRATPRKPQVPTEASKAFLVNPEKAAAGVKKTRNMIEVHRRADEMVAARQEVLRVLFPNPRPGDVREFVDSWLPGEGYDAFMLKARILLRNANGQKTEDD